MIVPDKYRKKPVIIEAMEWRPTPRDGHNVTCWMEENLYPGLIGDTTRPEELRYPDQVPGDDSRPDKGWYIDPDTGDLMIRTLEGDMRTPYGNKVIQGVRGEFYSCNPEIFAQTYEEVKDYREMGYRQRLVRAVRIALGRSR